MSVGSDVDGLGCVRRECVERVWGIVGDGQRVEFGVWDGSPLSWVVKLMVAVGGTGVWLGWWGTWRLCVWHWIQCCQLAGHMIARLLGYLGGWGIIRWGVVMGTSSVVVTCVCHSGVCRFGQMLVVWVEWVGDVLGECGGLWGMARESNILFVRVRH